MRVTFDDSLPRLVAAVQKCLGVSAVEDGIFLRDALGKLAFAAANPIDDTVRRRLEQLALETTSPYIDESFGAVTSPDELGEPELLTLGRQVFVTVEDESRLIRLLDRRIIGQDWLAQPVPGWELPSPARLVFWSLKGGVGRSTALAVTAADLSRDGKRVVAIDLDLEAPGIGPILLAADELPRLGALDWFVENGLSNFSDAELLRDFVGSSSLSQSGGVLHVVPAIGRHGRMSPENVIPKLGRAYLEDVSPSGITQSFLEQMQEFVTRLTVSGGYDVILIDARAGLNEATAGAILGLGADVLMFGQNTEQTFDGYRYLLSYMRGLPTDPDSDWRRRLKMVHAKADLEHTGLFNDRAFELFSQYLYEEDDGKGDAFNFDIDDPDAPHFPWPIADDGRYREFSPMIVHDQLTSEIYRATFGVFLSNLRIRIGDTAAQ